jgi:hypothetical protein
LKNELTLTQAARELGVNRQAIFTAIRRGLLPARRQEIPPFGTVIFIARPDFEAWAERSANRRRAQQDFRRKKHRERSKANLKLNESKKEHL